MFFLLHRSVSVADASPERALPLEAKSAHTAVGGGRSRLLASCVVSSRSLWPLSPALGWMSCEGWGHLGGRPSWRDCHLPGADLTDPPRIPVEIPRAAFSTRCQSEPPGVRVWLLKNCLTHLETFSPGSIDPTPGVVEASRELLVVSKVYSFISRFWEVLHFWEPYGPIHVEMEAILESPIKSTLKLSSQKILSALSRAST